jgi:hypothetical protein
MTQTQIDAVLAECRRLVALEDPNAIAADLQARGVNGYPSDTAYCPLAVHLRGLVGADDLYVGCSCIYSDADSFDELVKYAGEFDVLQSFISLVDARTYPFLERNAGI